MVSGTSLIWVKPKFSVCNFDRRVMDSGTSLIWVSNKYSSCRLDRRVMDSGTSLIWVSNKYSSCRLDRRVMDSGTSLIWVSNKDSVCRLDRRVMASGTSLMLVALKSSAFHCCFSASRSSSDSCSGVSSSYSRLYGILPHDCGFDGSYSGFGFHSFDMPPPPFASRRQFTTIFPRMQPRFLRDTRQQ